MAIVLQSVPEKPHIHLIAAKLTTLVGEMLVNRLSAHQASDGDGCCSMSLPHVKRLCPVPPQIPHVPKV